MDKKQASTNEKPYSKLADYFKEIIYGGIDGIVTTFAVVAGFTGAALSSDTIEQISFLVVLLFGLANLFADAASMGLGNLLSVRSEKHLYFAKRDRQMRRMEKKKDSVLEDAVAVLEEKGFSAEDSRQLALIYQHNPEYLVDFLMNQKLELSDPRGENEYLTGMTTFLSFMVFGAVPLIPFLLQTEGYPREAFLYSVIGTFTALLMLGLLKWRVIGTNFVASIFEVMFVGGIAAVIAYMVGTFFSL